MTEKQTRSESFAKEKQAKCQNTGEERKKILETTCERMLMITCYTVWQKQTKLWYSSTGCHNSVRRNRQNYDFFLGGKPSEKHKSEHRISKPALASAVFESGQLSSAGPKAGSLDLWWKVGRPTECATTVIWKSAFSSDTQKFSSYIQAGD